MKHALIVAHPSAASFTVSVANAWRQEAEAAGHIVVLRDLYRTGFDPALRDEEIPRPKGFQPAADVVAERRLIGDADIFIFVYPLWFYAPPAMLKGYVDRVFGMGFGYGPQQQGGNQGLLDGRRMLSFTSSGAPSFWVEERGDMAAIRRLFDDHFAKVCGLQVIDHVHFGGIVPELRPETVERHLGRVGETFAQHFHSIQ